MDNGLGRLETFLEDSTSFLSGGRRRRRKVGGERKTTKTDFKTQKNLKKKKRGQKVGKDDFILSPLPPLNFNEMSPNSCIVPTRLP